MDFTSEQIKRYGRHFVLPGIGEDGQKKLLASKVLIVGAGGLGSPAAIYLSAAGVGTLGLVDDDRVDLSNLQRQILYTVEETGKSKVESAEAHIRKANPDTRIVKHPVRLTPDNALALMHDYDVILDATDNFPSHYLVSDACVFLKKPDVHAAVFRFEGVASVFYAEKGPCYRCLKPLPPDPDKIPDCAQGGVLGVLPGLMGLVQATEAVKWLAGIGKPLVGRLLSYDALAMSFRELKFKKDPDCPVCGKRPTITGLIDYERFCGFKSRACSQGEAKMDEITVEALKKKIDGKEDFLFLDVREPSEAAVAKIEGARLVPLGEFQKHLKEFMPYRHKEIIIHCHHGPRSQKALALLKKKGFTCPRSVTGGIDAWSLKIDPSVPRY
ncbi:MAG: molybdopterin-synthase adenylyltransferase MoeB [Candidatus Omnitrophica bacterium]|nr:molybdopterin-synthase adenylyltransferase MoeB [Candidatus Omnitrophota bacterium]MDD5671591.1 molybdopterin-synthase adenylyltransferase MoeB [Candidatus Omnitrophota bacterium]